MKKREGVYYAGFIAGAATVSLLCRAAGMHQLMTVIAGVIAGVVTGTLAEKAYSSRTRGGQGDGGPKLVRCKNEYCDWEGERPHDRQCPRCGNHV